MFAHFDGVVAEKTADSIVLDVNGVGYLLFVSGATLSMAPSVGERMKLYSVLNVREDAMELFGFYSREEKAMYERLKGISGVGSRTALQILSSMSVRDLSLALVAGDANALTRVPGIGKKTAQRLVLELKDKVEDSQLTGAGAGVSPKTASAGPEAEAVAALVAL
ncbi:MAG: Holliday junction branch migration protein RuvA, partial [Clostridia bacterium]|nr:Holliday junction branch migration protein RuvA [Clostridia bacterium]